MRADALTPAVNYKKRLAVKPVHETVEFSLRRRDRKSATCGRGNASPHHTRPPNRPATVKDSLLRRGFANFGTAMANEQPHVQRWWKTVDGGKPIGVPLMAVR
jgi:hypothetical protein